MIDSGGDPKKGKSGPRVSNLIVDGKVGPSEYWGNRITGVYTWGNDNKIYDGGTLAPVTVIGARPPVEQKFPTLLPLPNISPPAFLR